MSDKKIIAIVNEIGTEFLISEAFLGYKYRKKEGQLYDSDSEVPTKLIQLYYGLNPDETTLNYMKSAFVRHYIRNESEIEGINEKTIHGEAEMKGLEVMYEYIHSEDINYLFDVYTLKDLNQKLFSFSEFPEFAGNFRNFPVYLPGAGVELCPWESIRNELEKVDIEVQKLLEIAPKIKKRNNIEELFAYLDRCIKVNCDLIKIHPFGDGNGRTVRGFTNKLFEDAGLPPVYIKANERTEYQKAMNKAINEGSYDDINQFYKYKICDSIIELDINEKLKENEKTLKKAR